jgi:peptide/nickel transport system ATP-binding protein
MNDHQAAPIIEARDLWIDYKLGKRWVNAIQNVNLSIRPLEIHGLVGESGSGKSTLALALMRYLAPNARISRGEILFEGGDLVPKTMREMRSIWGRQISLVPQDSLASLNPAYPVGEQIAEVFRLHAGAAPREAARRAVEMLERVRIADPAQVAKRYPHQLSGGQQQRVNIAMALATQPRLLILDEPTTSLDVTTQAVILDLFRDLIRDNRAAALYVSHDLALVAQLCDSVTVLYGGEVMASAPAKDLFLRPLHPYTISLLASLPRPLEGMENVRLPTIDGVAPSLIDRTHGCVFADRCKLVEQRCRDLKPPMEVVSEGRLIKCHRWREIADGSLSMDTTITISPPSAPPDRDYVFSGRSVSKTFGTDSLLDRILGRRSDAVRAVNDVSLRIRARSTLGLVGESGSGKTTLARCIVALETADSGEMELLDIPLSLKLSARRPEALRNLQFVFQNPNEALNPYRSVGDAIARTIRRLEGSLPPEVMTQRIESLLASVRLPADYASRFPAELSGGEKQRVAIARAFAADPALVIADEPTSALDVSVQSVILNLLKDLRAEKGASYLFISHDLNAVSYLADWIIVMYLGEIVEAGDVYDVYHAPSHPYTEALISAIAIPDPTIAQKRIRLDGEVPSPRSLPTGCRFHTRCPRKIGGICETDAPPFRDAGDGHFIRCHIPVDELAMLQQSAPEQAR